MAGETIVFGVTPMENIGVIQSHNTSESLEVAEAKGPDGKVIEQKGYSKTEEHQIEALFAAGTNPPAIGTVVTVAATESEAGWSGIVKSRAVNRSNSDYVKISMTVERKDQANLVAYADPEAGAGT